MGLVVGAAPLGLGVLIVLGGILVMMSYFPNEYFSPGTASGQVGAQPRSVTNSRRLIFAVIRSPRRRGRADAAGW